MEDIELRAQGMQKDKIGSSARLYVAKLDAANAHVPDGNARRPGKFFRWFWRTPQCLDKHGNDGEKNRRRDTG